MEYEEAQAAKPNAIRYYFHSRSAKVGKKWAERYRCYDNQATQLATGNGFKTSRPFELAFDTEISKAEILMKMRKTFAFSGKIDILDAESGNSLGIVTRNKKIFNTDERLVARFVSQRSWKEFFGEGLVDFAGELIFGGEGSGEGNPSACDYALVVDKKPVGILKRETFPFFPDPPKRTEPTTFGKLCKRILPKNLGSAIFDITPPLGWTLELHDPDAIEDTKLLISATFMILEINC